MISETKTVQVNKLSLLEMEIDRLPNSDKLSIFVKSEKLGKFFKEASVTNTEYIAEDADGNDLSFLNDISVNLGIYRNFPPRIQDVYGGPDLDFLRLKDLDKGVTFVVRSQAKKDQVKEWMLQVKNAVEVFYKENMKPIKYRMNLSIEEVV